MAQEVETANPQEEATPEDAERIGTLGAIFKEKEVVVGAPEVQKQPQGSGKEPMVVIRVNEDIEDMSYVAGGSRQSYKFEAGKQYRVPRIIAIELERIGKVWH